MEQIPDIIHESWHVHLQPLFDDPKMGKLKNLLKEISFYPVGPDNIFRVFSMPLEAIKVVILGQDPYPNGEAVGLAFAVKEGSKLPASLKVIIKEVYLNNGKESFSNSEKWETLQHWVDQGVFLLNTALTVEVKNAGSHLKIWEWFTREVIRIISENTSCVWLLWGAKAQAFKDSIQCGLVMDEYDVDHIIPTNGILQAPHPAAELYSAGKGQTFTGCNHFTICNKILINKKQSIINW